jgi:uncharacterized protein
MSKFVWYDLMTPDMDASSKFYSHVVGWKISDSGMPGMNYAIIKQGDVDVGGMMPPPPNAQGMPPLWNGYIYADNVDAAAQKAVKLGGSIFQDPVDIPDVGRFAVVADPSGASFLLFKNQGGEYRSPVAEGTPGHIGWRELMSGNWEKAWDFYASMFGWTKDNAMDMGPMGTYQMFKSGNDLIGGMMTKSPEDPMPPHWNYYFNVESAEAAMARATSLGAKITFGPMQVPGGSWALNGIDPQGAAFSLLSTNK